MVGKILCLIGLHKWIYQFLEDKTPYRKCTRCEYRQYGEYDMAYGTTTYK